MTPSRLAWCCSLALLATGCVTTPAKSADPSPSIKTSSSPATPPAAPPPASIRPTAETIPPAQQEGFSARRAESSAALEAIAQPGQCWVQAVVHPLPKREALSIVTRDAANRIVVEPAKLARTQQEIIVREGGITYRIEPPVYKEVKEKVLVKPEIRRTIAVPPVYEERQETVVIEAERTVLEPCRVPGVDSRLEKAARPLCAKAIPAKTKSITRKVLVQPATTREEVIPAEYKEITRWVLERPARAVPVELPATTAKVPVLTVAQPEQVREEAIPPAVTELMRTLYEGEPRVALRQAVCNHEATPELVKKVQTALKANGYDPGPIDGKLGLATGRALVAFQRDHGLAAGALTFETLERLGVR